MKTIKQIVFFSCICIIISCQTQRKLYELYKMEDFNISAANEFIMTIQNLPEINEISIIDTKADGNDFVVNRQWIFLDTNQTDKPNYYNYRKRANELNISPDSLLNCLNDFYKIGINEFCRDNEYLRFKVIVGFTTNKGYLYNDNKNIQIGDTLKATSVRNKDYHFKVVVTKKIDKNWFEYFETN